MQNMRVKNFLFLLHSARRRRPAGILAVNQHFGGGLPLENCRVAGTPRETRLLAPQELSLAKN